MSKFKLTLYIFLFLFFSLFLGTIFSIFVGRMLPERLSLVSSKSFDVSSNLLWEVLLDVESYPLWKPNVKKIELLGVNDQGFTKWREFYSLKKNLTFEITEYIPKTMIEVTIVETNDVTSQGIWIYKLSRYEDTSILQIKYYSISSNYLDRFIRRYIDTKYSEVDYFLLNLNSYINQLAEDQKDVQSMAIPKGS